MMKKACLVLTLAVSVSARANAFAPGAFVKNAASEIQSVVANAKAPFAQ
jgi:hypothetical protein